MKKNELKSTFPAGNEVKGMNKLLSNPKKVGNVALPLDATLTQKTKYEICQKIAMYRRKQDLTQKELARILGIDESRTSDILCGKIYRFSLDRLLELFQKIYPKAKIKLIA